jgi:hypothetical protein
MLHISWGDWKAVVDILLKNRKLLTTVIPMALNVPVGMGIIWVIFFDTTNFNLLKAPLRKNCIGST